MDGKYGKRSVVRAYRGLLPLPLRVRFVRALRAYDHATLDAIGVKRLDRVVTGQCYLHPFDDDGYAVFQYRDRKPFRVGFSCCGYDLTPLKS
jgi:hypothetical protein